MRIYSSWLSCWNTKASRPQMSSTWTRRRCGYYLRIRGWAVKGRQNRAVFASTRSFVTVNLAVRFSWSVPDSHACSANAKPAKDAPMLSQIICDGVTFKTLPPGLRPQWHCASHGPNHVSNQDTLLEFMRLMQDMVDSEGEPGRKWFCMLECAPSHIASAFIAQTKAELPRMTLCFVAPRLTSTTRPLDIAVMRPWKACIRTEASKQWARSALEKIDPAGLVRTGPQLKLNFQNLVVAATSHTSQRAKVRDWVWQFLLVLVLYPPGRLQRRRGQPGPMTWGNKLRGGVPRRHGLWDSSG